MKNILMFLIVSISLSLGAEIQNIQVAQRTDGSGILDLNYDLIDTEGTFPSFTIAIEMSIDNADYQSYSLLQMSGDVGNNVIPGLGKSIQIQAPENTYSNNVVFKIIASAQVVSGDLPFTMIAISSVEGVSSYQGETINYSFEIMQNELTNTNLVEFLETYEFTEVIDETYNLQNGYDNLAELPIYDCSNYYELHNSPLENMNTSSSWGCTDYNALNYNINANEDNGTCIYQEQLTCITNGSYNIDTQAGTGNQYDDCSCYSFDAWGTDYTTESMEGCNWWNAIMDDDLVDQVFNNNGYTMSGYEMQQTLHNYLFLYNFNQNQEFINNPQLSDVYSGFKIILNLCNNQDIINYPTELLNMLSLIIENSPDHLNAECLSFSENAANECITTCEQSYLEFNTSPPEGYNDNSSEKVNLHDFSTGDISFEGSSFVIASGQGSKPVQFNFESCIDAVIVSLMLDYYALRIPTGSEWVKAARGNNERCWPWLNSDCTAAASSYCANNIPGNCVNFNYDECISNILSVQTCNAVCQNDIGSSDSETGCYSDPENTDQFCDSQLASCQSTCQYDFDQDSQNCNYQNNDCTTQQSECINSKTSLCEYIESNILTEIITTPPSSDDSDRFFQYSLFNNRFFYEKTPDGFIPENDELSVSNVGSYPDGVSPFGLNDVIGNLPELVKYDNKYWIVGTTPSQEGLQSFSYDEGNGTIFENNSQAEQISKSANDNFYIELPIYGLRLIRTTQ
ncbi:hypothetical protein OAH62_02485 [Candidatus Marinimicrobia bacterium]|nr:hypothetical protein [Candidatus Neomarinimicrobiota bacterium]